MKPAHYVVGGIVLAVIASMLVLWSYSPLPTTDWRLLPTKKATTDLVGGYVLDDGGHPIPRAVITLILINADGKEISRHAFTVGPSGEFRIPIEAAPRVSGLAGGVIIAQADSYLSRRVNVMITEKAIIPSHLQLVLQPYNSTLAFI